MRASRQVVSTMRVSRRVVLTNNHARGCLAKVPRASSYFVAHVNVRV